MQDEALQSRIAALNLLDLNLEHLGVMVEHPAEAEAAEKAVKAAGKKLQQLNLIMSAQEKLSTLVATHQIIVGKVHKKKGTKGTTCSFHMMPQESIEAFAETSSKASMDALKKAVQEITTGGALKTDALNQDKEGEEEKQEAPGDEDKDKETKSNKSKDEKAQEDDIGSPHKQLPPIPAVSEASPSLTSAGADVLLPLLIFTIVKANPTNFLSNIRFIQRFRRSSQISGQASYCLTNMASVYDTRVERECSHD